MTEHFGWHSIFYVNLPFAIGILLLGTTHIPSVNTNPSATGFDFPGSVYLTAALTALLSGITLGPSAGWRSSEVVLLAGVFLLFAGLLLRREIKANHPLLSLELFMNLSLTATITVGFFQGVALFGSMLLIPMYLQHVHDFSPTHAGVLVLPLSISIMVMSPIVGRFSHKSDIKKLIFYGMLILTAGIGLFSRLTVQSPYWILATALIATGVGLGASSTPLNTNLINVVPQKQMGMASGLFNMIRYLGGVIGSTIFGAFMQQRTAFYLSQVMQNDYTAATADKIALGKAFPEVFLLAASTAALGMAAAWFIDSPEQKK
ncbi:hypothetical protein P22_1345 [Propionispora sp. 2/2-37]|nr:MFS transporter [Propionispora sp. 2/2-37]CUH95275.1 hypothetical protein P22_1345 [Propionispora sp. 2/2-37]